MPRTPPEQHAPDTDTPGAHTHSRRRALARILDRRLRAIDASLCPPGSLSTRGIHRILVCRPNHRLGNMLLISPLLREIETLYPGAEIDIVAAGHAADVLYGRRFRVQRIFAFHRRIARHLWSSIRLLRQIRESTYDLAIDACIDSNSGRLLLGYCKARFKLGFAYAPEPGSPLDEYTHTCPAHHARRGVHLLRTAYAGPTGSDWPGLNLDLEPDELRRGKDVLQDIVRSMPGPASGSIIVGVFANATGSKCYPEHWWAAFTAEIQSRRPRIQFVDVLAEHGNSQLPGERVPYFSRNLRRMAAVFANMDGFISGDCGVMHLAAASGTPTLGLFNHANLDKYGPFGDANLAIHLQRQQLDPDALDPVVRWLDELLAGHRNRTVQKDAS